MIKKPDCFGPFEASICLEHLEKASVLSVMHKSQSFLHAKICMNASEAKRVLTALSNKTSILFIRSTL